MHVISRKRLNEFAAQHSEAKASLAYWYELMKSGSFANFVELRATFPAARSAKMYVHAVPDLRVAG